VTEKPQDGLAKPKVALYDLPKPEKLVEMTDEEIDALAEKIAEDAIRALKPK
jgi:hypothetical protein